MKEPNYAPVYCALYPQLCEITREHGYALSIHGSLGRDMDLICVPWADELGHPQIVVDAICSRFAIRQIGGCELKKHGRVAYTISIGHGACALDLSFTHSPTWTAEWPPKATMEERMQAVLKASIPGKPFRFPQEVITWLHETVDAACGPLHEQLAKARKLEGTDFYMTPKSSEE